MAAETFDLVVIEIRIQSMVASRVHYSEEILEVVGSWNEFGDVLKLGFDGKL